MKDSAQIRAEVQMIENVHNAINADLLARQVEIGHQQCRPWFLGV